MNEIKITVKDIKSNPDYKDLKVSNWSLDRFLKRIMMLKNEDISGCVKGNNKLRIVDPTHTMMIENIQLNTDIYKINASTPQYPQIPDGEEMEICGANFDVIFLKSKETGYVNMYAHHYFIPIIQTFGKPKSITACADYPLKFEYDDDMEILLAPHINPQNESVNGVLRFIFDFEAWLPKLYNKQIRTPKEKIGYLYTLDQSISLNEALILMERL